MNSKTHPDAASRGKWNMWSIPNLTVVVAIYLTLLCLIVPLAVRMGMVPENLSMVVLGLPVFPEHGSYMYNHFMDPTVVCVIGVIFILNLVIGFPCAVWIGLIHRRLMARNVGKIPRRLAEFLPPIVVLIVVSIGCNSSLLKAQGISQGNACVGGLLFIDHAKMQWATVKHMSDGARVVFAEVDEYLPGFTNPPICPSGGTYIYNLIGEDPICTYRTNTACPEWGHHFGGSFSEPDCECPGGKEHRREYCWCHSEKKWLKIADMVTNSLYRGIDVAPTNSAGK
jgi:hypothetical protein